MYYEYNYHYVITQDALHKQARSGSLSNAVQLAIDSHELAKHPIFDDNLKVATLDYVENVAKLRYVLVTVACLLHDYYIDSTKLSLLSADETNIVDKLLVSIQRTCLAIDETTKNAFVVADFLIKCIVRKYGMSTLLALCEKEKDFQWLIPKHLQKDSCKSQVC